VSRCHGDKDLNSGRICYWRLDNRRGKYPCHAWGPFRRSRRRESHTQDSQKLEKQKEPWTVTSDEPHEPISTPGCTCMLRIVVSVVLCHLFSRLDYIDCDVGDAHSSHSKSK
jgi:hypothetical protein